MQRYLPEMKGDIPWHMNSDTSLPMEGIMVEKLGAYPKSKRETCLLAGANETMLLMLAEESV